MLSRHADAVFWLGRYIERAEATARMVDVHYHFLLESPLVGEAMRWSSILAVSGSAPQFARLYGDEPTERNVIQFFAFDERNPDAIVECLHHARENGRAIRDQISSEMWECLNKTWIGLREWNLDRVMAVTPNEFFSWVKDQAHMFRGITNRTMLLGEGRDFLDTGRFLERIGQTSRLVDVKYHDLLPRYAAAGAIQEQHQGDANLPDPLGVGGEVDVHGWIALLKSVGGFEAYTKTHHTRISPDQVVAFLLLNEDFPASLRHCARRLHSALCAISFRADAHHQFEPERLSGRLLSELDFTTSEEIIARGLHEFLESVVQRADEIGVSIATTYLRY